MGVVAAGVADALVLGAVGDPFLQVLHPQSVRICPEGDGPAIALFSVDPGVDTGLSHPPVRNAGLIQLLFDALCRAIFLKARLRMGVEISPQSDEIVPFFFNVWLDSHYSFSQAQIKPPS